MPEAPLQKNFFQFNKGINTEQSELTMQDGFSVDEANYELLVDGSRRRRRGLRQEASGGTITHDTQTTGAIGQSYVWRAAGGDYTKNFIVHKKGQILYFTPDEDGGSASPNSSTIDLKALKVAGVVSSMYNQPLDFSQGRGELFISGKYIYPTRIIYDPVGDTFTTDSLEIQIRDYDGIDDGVPLDTQPASGLAGAAAISDLESSFADHYYNLLNRGWNATQILAYENNITGTARFPAKQQWFADGYKRVDTTSGVEPTDGTMQFDATKLDAEIYGGSDAPTGSMIINVFDDTTGFREVSLDGAGTYTDIAAVNIDVADTTTEWTVTVTDASHPFSVSDEVNWKDKPIMFISGIPAGIPIVQGDTSTITAIDGGGAGTDWSFEIDDYTDVGWDPADATFSTASYWGVNPIARSSGTGPLTVGPKAIEFHGGRLFFAGIEDSTWTDYLFFSQVVRSDDNYHRCHTEADPTSPKFNAPVSTDGGFLIIPNLGNVKKLMSLQDSLLIFSDQGIWEVRGKGTFFDPTQYNVRKITGAECGSPYSPIEVEGTAVYTGPKGVYNIAPDRYTRQLEATNISDDKIRTAWNNITDTYEPYVKTVYDDAEKRLYFLQPGSGNLSATHAPLVGSAVNQVGLYNLVWIYDLRVGAWYKYIFNGAAWTNVITDAFALTGQDSSSGRKKVKFVVSKSTTTSIICDFSEAGGTGYQDFDGNTVAAFVLTHYDNVGTMTQRRHAPIVTVFSKRTTTGYAAVGNGLSAVNPSSTTMNAYWDWTDDAVSGKIGSDIEVYRDVRGFAPSGTGDVDGYPVVVTRNKVRGRGRVLQLKFAASTDSSGEDSHILGYTVDYKVSRRR